MGCAPRCRPRLLASSALDLLRGGTATGRRVDHPGRLEPPPDQHTRGLPDGAVFLGGVGLEGLLLRRAETEVDGAFEVLGTGHATRPPLRDRAEGASCRV